MHRYIACICVIMLALALVACQGKNKLLQVLESGTPLPAQSTVKQGSAFSPTNEGVWSMMGSTPDNTRHRYTLAGYEGPDPALGGVGLLWETPVTDDNPPPIYSSPVVHLGYYVDEHGILYWEDIFVMTSDGNLHALDGWDAIAGQQQNGKVFGHSGTSGSSTFVVGSAGTCMAYDAGNIPQPDEEGSFNSVVFCDGTGHLRLFYSNGDFDGLMDPTYGGDGLFYYDDFHPEYPPPPSYIGGDYAACALTSYYDGCLKSFYTGTYYRNATLNDPAGRLYRLWIDPYLRCDYWQQGDPGVPLERIEAGYPNEPFDVESMMCFAQPSGDIFVVGRARPHNTNKARMFVYDQETGAQLAVSEEFDWFADADSGITPGMHSSPVIEDQGQHHDVIYAYLAAPHGNRMDPQYEGDVIREYIYAYDDQLHQWVFSLNNVYTMRQLMSAVGTLPPGVPTPYKYVAASPALVYDEGILVIALNEDPLGYQGWKLAAFDMNVARSGANALIAVSEEQDGRSDSSPAIDAADNVWIASDDELFLFQNFVAQTGDQTPDWSSFSTILGRVWSSPSIGYTSEIDPEHIQHTVYIADDLGNVYAFADNLDALPPPPPPTDTDWPQFGHDLRNQRRTPVETAGLIDTVSPWPVASLTYHASDPSVSSNGYIYVADYDGRIFSVDPATGAVLDDYIPNPVISSDTAPAISSDGSRVYYTYYNWLDEQQQVRGSVWLCALTSSLTPIWEKRIGHDPTRASAVIGDDGLIYVASIEAYDAMEGGVLHTVLEARLFSYDADGNLVRESPPVRARSTSTPAISANNEIFLLNDCLEKEPGGEYYEEVRRLYCYKEDPQDPGAFVISAESEQLGPFGEVLPARTAPVIGRGDTIFCCAIDATYGCHYDRNAEEITVMWRNEFAAPQYAQYCSPAIGAFNPAAGQMGYVYVIECYGGYPSDSRLVALDPGTGLIAYSTAALASASYSSPVLSEDGWAYFATMDALYHVNFTAEEPMELLLSATAFDSSSPVIGDYMGIPSLYLFRDAVLYCLR